MNEKVRELLELLPSRGPQAFVLFTEALDETDQSHATEALLGWY